jgi:hypothetical protein
MNHFLAMRYLGLLLFALNCIQWQCSISNNKYPSSHIMSKNNKDRKNNIKYQREHAKAAKNKRAQLESYHPPQEVAEKKKKK